MRSKGLWVLCAVVLGAVAFATAGCGGGGNSTTTVTVAADTTTTEATTTAETTTTEATTTEETTTEEGTTTEAGTTTEETDTTATDTTGTDTTALGNLSFLTSAKCRQYVQLLSNYASALAGAGGTDTEKAAQALQEIADQAPDEIKGDFQTLADAYSKIADALKGTDLSAGQTPDAATLAKLAQLGKEIDSAKVSQASTNISTWLTKNCTNG